ncbi:ABC transporter permease subunit [Salinibacter altiplanensis]|uniref:ABC transporter permease subunit n=1 Tax=Salinibacter altiplanensis TaxID=1803181 RepID=UPI000C9F6E0B
MRAHILARKDFHDARRSRVLWALSATFLALAMLVAGLYAFVPAITAEPRVSTMGLLGFLASPVTLFVAVASVVACYKSVVGETESGSGKLLLSLPHTRRDVVLGKVVGRGLVLAVPVAVGLLSMLAVVFAGGVPFSPVEYAVFVVVTLFYVLAYVAVFVGVSAMTTSTTRAATISVLLLVVFEVAWDVVPLGAWFVASGFQVPSGFLAGNFGARPDWVTFLFQLPPSGAYQNAIGGFLSGSGSEPFFLTNWFSLIVLALWGLVSLAIGDAGYRRADL